MWNLILQIISAILGFWLADRYVPGVDFTGPFFILPRTNNLDLFFKSLIFAGIILGLLNYFVKPILKKISLPLRIITFDLFSFIIAMGLVWVVDIFFPELIIKGIKPLFFTTLIIWGLNFFLSKWWPAKPRQKKLSIEKAE